MTSVNDSNVTITLGGAPTSALLQAVTLTMGWSGTLADARIASAATWNSKQAGHVNLTSLSSLAYVATSFVKMTGIGTFTLDTNTYLTANQTVTLTGDVTGSGGTSIATTISANVVTNTKLADMANSTMKGRVAAGSGDPEDLSVTQVKTLLGLNSFNQSTRIYRAVPSGTVNGSNVIFTFVANIMSGSEEIYKNGILMNAGAGNDYTITYGATTTITFATAPSNTPFADIILVNYSI
ncbi:MAG: hypothetical protein ACOH2V_00165 [Candidatus Saccharimonadaceae bacterium]